MSQTDSLPNSNFQSLDWQTQLRQLAFAHGEPGARASFKSTPQDFCVTELHDLEPSDEGEHYCLDITKTKLNTDQLGKQLARFAGVAYRDVSYAGLKDYFAQSRQWFSVWKPRGGVPDWNDFELPGVQIHQVVKHTKKIKRGSHRGNRFRIVLRDLSADIAELEARLDAIRCNGVPNYYGEQRFGRDGDNMRQAYAMLLHGRMVKNKSLRGLLLSSARSWLFNQVLSARVAEHTWDQLKTPEPANLAGSNSVFISTDDAQQEHRLNSFDIHPTAPLWGDKSDQAMSQCAALHAWELEVLAEYKELMDALVGARVDYSRRATRCAASDFTWRIASNTLVLEFSLPKGQYATSILRETIQY